MIVLVAIPSRAATNVVTTLADSGPGSLRQAILDANAAPGADNILFTNVSGTIRLASSLPIISDTVTITGPGMNVLTISGQRSNRVFEIAATVAITDLTIAFGFSTNSGGAGILNSGNLALTNCAVLSNIVGLCCVHSGGDGGGIWSSGSLVIDRCQIRRNTCFWFYPWLPNTFFPPSPTRDGWGGGICVENGTASISKTTISFNQSSGSAVPLSNQTCCYTNREARGGGIFLRGGSVGITDSTISGNRAAGFSGGSGPCPNGLTFGCDGANARGGGISVAGGLVCLTNCTISGNQAQGGSGGLGSFSGGDGGFSFGGGIDGSTGTVCMVSCTVYQNSSLGGSAYTGGTHPGNPGYGDFYGVSGGARSLNTIVQYSGSPLLDLGYNFVVYSNELYLGNLTSNGGPTFTHAFLSNNPAIDAGDDTLTGTDQRGRPRRSGAHVDIGAFEFTAPTFVGLRKLSNGAVSLTTVSDTPFNVVANSDVAAPSNQWINLGPATAIGPGVYEFTDTTATNNPLRFFRLRWP